MQVDRYSVRSHRERRAWSQEHLARASGLGLRTIQRIEATGLASYDSIRSIAAALECPLEGLLLREAQARGSPLTPAIKRVSGVVAVGGIAAAFLFATGVFAKDVALNVGLDLNGEKRSMGLITPEGEDAEIRVDGVIRVLIVPTIRPDGRITLAAKVYESKEGQYVLVAQPMVVTANHEQAEIRLSSEQGGSLSVAITPDVK